MLRFALLVALVGAIAAYTYQPTTSAQISAVLYYYRTPSCSGAPVLVATRYSDLVQNTYGPTASSPCSANAQCASNSAAQTPGFCNQQLVSIIGHETTFDAVVANANKSVPGGYNNPTTLTYGYGACVPSRSYNNCYYVAIPIDMVVGSSSSLVASVALVVASLMSMVMLA